MKKAPKPGSFKRRTTAPFGGMLLQSPVFADLPWLVHGFSTRRGGVSSFANPKEPNDLNLGNVAWDSPRNVRENRRRLVAELGAGDMKPVVLRQIHSDLIRVIESNSESNSESASIPSTGDALITDRAGLLLSVLAADCLPILLVDAKQRVVAAVHCGWRGTAKRIVEKAVGTMRMLCGSRPEDLRAAIGPGIRACCYKVGPEVEEAFASQFAYAERLLVCRNEPLSPLEEKYPRLFKTYKSPDYKMFHESGATQQMYLDLVAANYRQLSEAGLSQKQIGADAPCTSCHPELFFSHRRDAGKTGRMMGVIGIRASRQQNVRR
jgi:purine-nucleoside/S-methyl-5'-thioadenosine phosphorylase / adenosine deaminase